MARGSKPDPTESGVLVYPRLPVPEQKARQSEPRMPRPGRPLANKTLGAIFVGGLVAGIVVGFVLRPTLAPDKRLGKLEHEATEEKAAAGIQKDRADQLAKQVTAAAAKQKDLEAALATAKKAQSQLAEKAADAEKKARDADAVQAKLKAAIDKSSGSVSAEGEEIHLQLVDKVLFKLGRRSAHGSRQGRALQGRRRAQGSPRQAGVGAGTHRRHADRHPAATEATGEGGAAARAAVRHELGAVGRSRA